jgi:hypothetical protein
MYVLYVLHEYYNYLVLAVASTCTRRRMYRVAILQLDYFTTTSLDYSTYGTVHVLTHIIH